MSRKTIIVQPFIHAGSFVKRTYRHWHEAYKTATCQPPVGRRERKSRQYARKGDKAKAREKSVWESADVSALLDDIWQKDRSSYPLAVEAVQKYTEGRTNVVIVADVVQVLLESHRDHRQAFVENFAQILPAEYILAPCWTPSGVLCVRISSPGSSDVTYRAGFGLTNPSFSEMDTLKATEQIRLLLSDALAHPEYEEAITTLCGENAQRMLDELQNRMDSLSRSNQDVMSENKERRTTLKLLCALSQSSKRLPKTFFVTNISGELTVRAECGRNADIYFGTRSGRKVIVKRYRVETPSTKERSENLTMAFWLEALLWRQLSHPNIVPVEGIYQPAVEVFMNLGSVVMPRMENGSIMRFLKTVQRQPLVKDLNKWLLDIAQGLHYLHREHIVHGDLRGANVLLDDESVACLSDYGILPNPELGSLSYMDADRQYNMAPELLHPEATSGEAGRPTYASDSYAFGLVCVEIYSRETPFSPFTRETQRKIVFEGSRPSFPAIPSGDVMKQELWSLVQDCWHQHPAERPTSEMLVSSLAISSV